MGLKKYFIAIVIPEPFLSQIEGIKNDLHEIHGLRGALRSPAHITLHRPFEWKEEKEPELIQKISSFRFPVSFPLELKDFAFFEPRVIFVNVVKNDALYQLHDALTAFAKKELRLFNESDDLRGFHPHVTVAFRDLKKPKFYELKSAFESKSFAGTFNYSGFSILKLEKKWEEIRFISRGPIL